MTYLHAAAFAAGFALRMLWLLFLPIAGLAALTGVPLAPLF